jgi:hypothetical protein
MRWEDHESKRMEPAGSGATWTGSPKGVFAGRKHHKPPSHLKQKCGSCRRHNTSGGGLNRLVRHNFITTLPEKRDDEEGNTYQRGVPENKRTQQSISGRRSEQIS